MKFHNELLADVDWGSMHCALVIGHPGHEGRVFEWVRLAQPKVFTLTAGSRAGSSKERLDESDRICIEAGGAIVHDWSRCEDRSFYADVLAENSQNIVAETRALAQRFADDPPDVVVTDSWQWYNVAHDICHLLTRVAVEMASRQTGRKIELLVYPVVPKQLAAVEFGQSLVYRIELAEEAAAHKLEQISKIADIKQEIAELLDLMGDTALNVEEFWSVLSIEQTLAEPADKPFYERHGEKRVAQGLYKDVLRWASVKKVCADLLELRPQQGQST